MLSALLSGQVAVLALATAIVLQHTDHRLLLVPFLVVGTWAGDT